MRRAYCVTALLQADCSRTRWPSEENSQSSSLFTPLSLISLARRPKKKHYTHHHHHKNTVRMSTIYLESIDEMINEAMQLIQHFKTVMDQGLRNKLMKRTTAMIKWQRNASRALASARTKYESMLEARQSLLDHGLIQHLPDNSTPRRPSSNWKACTTIPSMS